MFYALQEEKEKSDAKLKVETAKLKEEKAKLKEEKEKTRKEREEKMALAAKIKQLEENKAALSSALEGAAEGSWLRVTQCRCC